MIHRVCGLLLATYCLAWFFPWGGWFGLTSNDSGGEISRWLLALLLFLGSAGQSKDRVGTKIPLRVVVTAIFMISLASLVGVASALGLLELASSPHSDDIRTGLLIVFMMPIASAMIAWTHVYQADRSLSLILLIASTLFAPVSSMIGMSFLSMIDTRFGAYSPSAPWVWQKTVFTFLIYWVLIPSCIGFMVSRISSLSERLRPDYLAKHLSLPILLMLNYINASGCLPSVAWNIELIFEITGAVLVYQLIAIIGFAFIDRIRFKCFPLTLPQERSIALAVLLKNTGAALVLIQSIIPEPAMIMLPVLVSTLTQHLLASQLFRIQEWVARSYRRVFA